MNTLTQKQHRGATNAPRGTAVYLRVSTEEQRERQSIATQREFAEQYSAREEITVSRWFADEAISGTVPLSQRPAGARLIQDAREGVFGTLLVYRMDRLGRDPLSTLQAVAELRALGVKIVSMTEACDDETPSGRLLMTLLSGVAGFERDTIIQRSIDGTNRLAREGAWLGGVVPFGYRVEGKGRDARLVISNEPLPGLGLSEADVVRLIYQLAADEQVSCVAITERLTGMGVSPAYVRDGRQVSRGKRKQATAGIWRPARVRNLIISTTYKGTHEYGKRSKRQREPIPRPVPAIVSAETWERAQATLRRNMLFSKRNATREYLMRGLMKCGLCGLTYVGVPNGRRDPTVEYRCNGRHGARGLYGLLGRRCPSSSINADIEDVVWSDIAGFLREPGDVLRQLAERLDDQADEAERLQADAAQVQRALDGIDQQRDTILKLFRQGRIDARALDRQLDDIQRDEAELRAQRDRLLGGARSAKEASAVLRSAETLLSELHQRLDGPLTWDLKRQIVEALVEGVRVETLEEDGQRVPEATVTYRFAPIAVCTGTDSSPRPA